MRHRSRLLRIYVGVAVAVSFLLFLSGCSTSARIAGADRQSMLVLISGGQTTSFDPEVGASGEEVTEYFGNVGATLVRNPLVDVADGGTTSGAALQQDVSRFEPLLAQSYETSADGLTYTFHLNPNARSTAGHTLDADDVVWSFQRKFAVPTGSLPFVAGDVLTDPDRQVRKIDDMTVSISIDREAYGFTLMGLLSNVLTNIYDSEVLKPTDKAWTHTTVS